MKDLFLEAHPILTSFCRYYTCLYTSPSLTFLAWWSNRNEAQLRGFLSLTDYNVKCSLADSFLIIPVSKGSAVWGLQGV